LLAFEASAIPVSIIAAGFLTILLLGTATISLRWLLPLLAVGSGITAWQVRKHRLPLYRIAQIIDSRLQLSDSLSTAWFLSHEARQERRDLASRFQLEHAEKLASALDLSKAFPIRTTRNWTVAFSLIAVSCGLLATRYVATDGGSLRQALIRIPSLSIDARRHAEAAEKNNLRQSSPGEEAKKAAQGMADARSMDQQQLASTQSATAGAANKPDGSHPDSATPTSDLDNRSRDGKGGARQDGNVPVAQENKPGEKGQHDESSNRDAQQATAGKNEIANDKANTSGLLDKMKDAFSSLMAKMRPNADAPKQKNSDSSEGDQPGGSETKTSKNQDGQQQKGASESSGADQNSPEDVQGQATEKSQSARGRGSDQKNPSDPNAQSGIGSQDGDKASREAQERAAAGKLAEIIGKRSANLTGDITIESSSGKQQLKTEYSQRVGHHADLGGEINRDEVPLMYQEYVREYMEQVRKQAKNP
jgi:chromatin remodeling complex protein RSC6